MSTHAIVLPNEWLTARKVLLEKEKEFERRELPWVKVEKEYLFDSINGKETLAELFENRSQLIVYHFMYGPDWEEGCPSCSFWADNFNNIIIHLNHRDITMIAVAKARLETLESYKVRMGWSFKWASSFNNDFNRDYQVSFTPEELDKGEVYYNYTKTTFPSEEGPGISVFYKNNDGDIFHTYSCYARGLDILNGAYHYMDLVPKGRDEDRLEWSMAWLRRHDQY
jgi:predicted dithiol-disulfide oxidoreductase (DUF899 family)